MDEILSELGEYVSLKLADETISFSVVRDELTFIANRDNILNVMRFLHDDSQCRFISIVDVAGVDYPGRAERFEVVYHLLSPTRNLRCRVKVSTSDEVMVPSITDLFPGAGWYEREAYDMFGILFSGHSDMRRLLTDYGFSGHPLRKDFPVSGYVELRYDSERKKVIYEPVKLNQEFRIFDNLSPWDGTDYVLPGDEKA